MTDPLDDFEFKPLTEGLGFHKKSQSKDEGSNPGALAKAPKQGSTARAERDLFFKPSAPAEPSISETLSLSTDTEDDLLGRTNARPTSNSKAISDLIASLPPSLDFVSETETAPAPRMSDLPKKSSFESKAEERPQIYQPLAREEYKASQSTAQINPQTSAINQALPAPGTKAATLATAAVPAPTTSAYRERLDESYARSFPHLERRKEIRQKPMEIGGLEPTGGHLGAGLLDAMVVTGMSTILLVCILLITKVNLVGLLSNAQTDGPTQFHLALLFIAVLQLYMLTARSFFGASLGEWAFDLQLGSSEDQKDAIYPLQVAWRTLLITITGFTLPVLSFVMRRDLAKAATGLALYQKS